MAIEIRVIDGSIIPIVSCDVCKGQIQSESDGVVLCHDLGGWAWQGYGSLTKDVWDHLLVICRYETS